MNVSARQAWLLRQYERSRPGDLRLARYHVAHAVEIAPPPDLDLVEAELARLFETYEVLRWTFERDSTGAPRAKLGALPPLLQRRPAPTDEAAFQAQLLTDARAEFDLVDGPLFQALAYVRSPGQVVLLLRAHHLIVDGASLIILMRSLLAGVFGLETHFRVGPPYADWVAWQQTFLKSADGERLLDYWLAELSDLPPPLALPYDVSGGGREAVAAVRVQRTLDAELVSLVRDAAASLKIISFRFYLAAYAVLIHAVSGVADAPVSLASAARSRLEFIETVGWFNDTLVLREPIMPDDSFASFANRLARTLDRTLQHDGYPLHLIAERLNEMAPNQPTCLDEAAFSMIAPNPRTDHEIGNLASALAGTSASLGKHVVRTWPVSIPYASPHQISIRILERPDTTYLSASFNASRFSGAAAERLVSSFERLLHLVSAAPDASLAQTIERLAGKSAALDTR